MNTTLTTEKPKLCTASFIKICLVNFFIFVNFHALLPTFPFFITYLGGDAMFIAIALCGICSSVYFYFLLPDKNSIMLVLYSFHYFGKFAAEKVN